MFSTTALAALTEEEQKIFNNIPKEKLEFLHSMPGYSPEEIPEEFKNYPVIPVSELEEVLDSLMLKQKNRKEHITDSDFFDIKDKYFGIKDKYFDIKESLKINEVEITKEPAIKSAELQPIITCVKDKNNNKIHEK